MRIAEVSHQYTENESCCICQIFWARMISWPEDSFLAQIRESRMVTWFKVRWRGVKSCVFLGCYEPHSNHDAIFGRGWWYLPRKNVARGGKSQSLFWSLSWLSHSQCTQRNFVTCGTQRTVRYSSRVMLAKLPAVRCSGFCARIVRSLSVNPAALLRFTTAGPPPWRKTSGPRHVSFISAGLTAAYAATETLKDCGIH